MTGFILGGGVTGLAAGMASGFTVLEAAQTPGGICASYYRRPGDSTRLPGRPVDDEAYRFELGGGHWIFGSDPEMMPLLHRLSPLKTYSRKASIFFPGRQLHLPYPIQNHAELLGADVMRERQRETARTAAVETFRDWLESSFGPTLCREFFFPFHERYTAGLYRRIAPQDGYKSPNPGDGRGYNVEFGYPVAGLDALIAQMAAQCCIEYASQVTAIVPGQRLLRLADGRELAYTRLLSTLPLNRMLELTGIAIDAPPDPWTSVLVLNIAARRGRNCPDVHWTYVPHSDSGFHRVGFYDHVERSFLPRSVRDGNEFTSLYVERAFAPGDRPTPNRCDAYIRQAIAELQQWGFIEDVILTDPTWIEIAYTWSWPGSPWKSQALAALEANGITQVGRYARWQFQGIADSVRDGLLAGTAAREHA